jgi:hypothetical protein
VLRRSLCTRVPPSLPRRNDRLHPPLASPAMPAFPWFLSGSASALNFSGPAQRSLLVAARVFAKSPSDPLHRRLQPSCYLHDCSDCYRLERQLPGGATPHWEIAPFHGAPKRNLKHTLRTSGGPFSRSRQPGTRIRRAMEVRVRRAGGGDRRPTRRQLTPFLTRTALENVDELGACMPMQQHPRRI